MDFYIVNSGDRPDLAALDVNPPEEYIGSKILPVVNVADKSGTIYYRALTADSAAQTGRVTGAAPNGTQISSSNTTYTAAEVIKRGSIAPDEMKQMGGLDKGEMIGAAWAKRQVMKAIETAQCAKVLVGTPSAQFDPDKLLTIAQTALQAIRLYSGKTTLVTATATFKAMVQACLASSTFGPVFSRVVSGANPSVAVTGMNFEAWKNGMALVLGVDQVLLGDDEIWNDAAVAGRFAIGKYDTGGDEFSHKWNPIFGKTYMYLPDGAKNPWEVQAIADRLNINNHFDAKCWYKEITLNTGAQYLFDGVQ